MAIITKGTFSYKLLFPLFAGLFYGGRNMCFKKDKSESQFFKILLMEIGMMLSILIELISIIKRKDVTKQQPIKEEFAKFFGKYKKEPKLIWLVFLCFFLDIIGFFLNFIGDFFEISENPNEVLIVISIIRLSEFYFVCFLTITWLKIPLYRHHYAGLIIISVGFIIFSIPSLFNISMTDKKKLKRIIITFCFSLGGNIIYSILEIMEKWIMDFKFISPFETVGIQGMFGFIILSIISIFCPTYISYSVFTKENLKDIIAYIFASTGYNIFNHLTNKNLGPSHRVICDCFISIVTIIITFVSQDKLFIIFTIIGIILIFIGIILYNEVIIINCCKLDENTKIKIDNRITEESSKMDLFIKERLTNIQEEPNNNSIIY